MKKVSPLHRLILLILCAVAASVTATPQTARPEEPPPLSITLEEYPYPYPVSYLPLAIEGQDLKMAYMDVLPKGSGNGKTVILLHGKNFFGEYWKDRKYQKCLELLRCDYSAVRASVSTLLDDVTMLNAWENERDASKYNFG